MSGAPTEQELTLAQQWFAEHFAAWRPGMPLPFSFRLGDRPAKEIDWAVGWTPDADGGGVLCLADGASGLRVTCEARLFADFPAVEWVLRFADTGAADTPIIGDIMPLDVALPLAKETGCVLRHARGSDCKLDDFEPLETALPPGGKAGLAAVLGRSSNHTLPFFNLVTGEEGIIGAIGWTGGWQASFARDGEGPVSVRAGMPETHLKLHPGESIRSPRMLLLFWQGEPIRSHNLLRRFILAHHTPRPNGEPLQAPIGNAVWGENRVANQLAKIEWLARNQLPIDTFWIDAGWHGDAEFLEGSTVFNSGWGAQVGNWWPNQTTYPEGLAPIGQRLAELGMGFVLWLEPERVFQGTAFTREHPEWLLGPIGGNFLYNLGIPEAREALTDLISNLISEGGITCYRQDFNTDPAPFWEAADEPDRLGMTEIRHIEGLYAFWDALQARHPGLIIDNCSSGGRRLDLESISRSIPLWRSDFQCWPEFDVTSQQTQTHGLGLWVPLSTGCCDRPDTYAFRSALGPGIVMTTNIFEQDPSDHLPPEWGREMLGQLKQLRPYFHGDFYPLLDWSLSHEMWAAWQYDRPDLGEGMVLAFRRPRSPFTTMKAKLRGLEAGAAHELRDLDSGARVTLSGAALMDDGLEIVVSDQPGTRVLVYRKVSG
jgi:alpha-galactosidase